MAGITGQSAPRGRCKCRWVEHRARLFLAQPDAPTLFAARPRCGAADRLVARPPRSSPRDRCIWVVTALGGLAACSRAFPCDGLLLLLNCRDRKSTRLNS